MFDLIIGVSGFVGFLIISWVFFRLYDKVERSDGYYEWFMNIPLDRWTDRLCMSSIGGLASARMDSRKRKEISIRIAEIGKYRESKRC